MADASDVEQLNAAMHTLLLRLHIARLDLWSPKLAGIGYLDLHALSFIEDKPRHTLAELREFLNVPQSTLTSIIDRLEQRRLARRAVHPTDKRSYLIELTRQGRALQREHHRVERAIMRKVLDALPRADERARFVELFGKIAAKPAPRSP